MRRPGKLLPLALFVTLAPLDCRSQVPASGDIMQSGTDRCARERERIANDPLTKRFGPPDYPLIKSKEFREGNWYRCGGNSCYPDRATCWGKGKRDYCGTGDVIQSGRRPPGKSPCDVIQSGGKPGKTPNDVIQSGGTPSRTPSDVHQSSDKRKQPKTDESNTDRREKICDFQHLAALITMRYGTGHPIATYKVVNSNSPTYLVVLSGVEWEKPAQATNYGDALIGWMNLYMLDSYRAAVIDAIVKGLPPGAKLIIAGHSQGGVEAQNVVEELTQRGFKVLRIISYGAPIVANETPGTNYLHIRAKDEPLQALDQRYVIRRGAIRLSLPGTGNLFGPDGSHNNYDKPSSGLSGHWYLETPCFDIDLDTLQQFEAPTALNRALGKTDCPPAKSGCPAQKVRWSRPAGLPTGQPASAMDRGLLLADENVLKNIAATKGLIFLVRDSSEPALRWIGRPGYKAKPEAIKGKTLKQGDLKGISSDQVDKYLGLASARGMSPEDRKALKDAGYMIQRGTLELITDKDGNKFYSDTDLHGVYDLNGNNAWSSQLEHQLSCGMTDQGIQHDTHDNWPDRNNKAIAKANYGPQIGPRPGQDASDPRTITAILPDCTTLRISTLAEMKQLYQAIGVNFNKLYPNF